MNSKKREKDVPIGSRTPLVSYESGWGPDRASQEKALGNYTESVSKRLKAARKARSLSMRDIARITEAIEVSASTIRNYETRPNGFRQIQLGIIQALSMALEYDVRALLCLAPFDSNDDEDDLERASLEPTCEGVCWLLEGNAPKGTKLWEIYEHRNDLSLIVIKKPGRAKVDPTDRRHAVPCDASGAYELLTLMLCLEQGYATADDPAKLSEVAARLKPHISNWNTRNGKEVEGASTASPAPLHRRRLAREKATLAELGNGWAYRESDGERCPYLKIDAHHEAEVRGFMPDFGATCEVSLWHVPDPRNPEEAREAGQITGVPCSHTSINAALSHLQTHTGDAGTYRIDFGKVVCEMRDNTCPVCGAKNIKEESTKYDNDEVSQDYYCSECGSK